MTPIEAIIVGGIVSLISAAIATLIGSKSKATKAELKEHIEAEHPHPQLPCMGHTEKLNGMDRKLDQLIDLHLKS